MGVDIRIPIGLMFAILGALLAIFGLATAGDGALYAKSLNMNVNLYTGLGMFVFGAIMLVFAWKPGKKKKG
jgi:hypothetical protein